MPAFIDLSGQRFGRLVVIERAPVRTPSGRVCWIVRCDCGEQRTAIANNLQRGKSQSCGCANREATGRRSATHKMSKTRVYRAYCLIRRRCYNPNDNVFRHYGGRGITCEFSSFEEFYAEVGDPPGPRYSIDRIDNEQAYKPGNVRWATHTEQTNNKRNNKRLTYQGVTRTQSEWATYFGVNYHTFRSRIYLLGWSVEKAGTAPGQCKKH